MQSSNRNNGLEICISKESKNNSKSYTQRKTGKRVTELNGSKLHDSLQRPRVNDSCRNTEQPYFNRIIFQNKVGFEILKKYKGSPVYSKNEKIRALMLYNCIKLLPEFEDKEFENVSDAISYVYKEAFRILNCIDYTLIYENSEKDEFGIPKHYVLQVIYESFEPYNGVWQSYCDIDIATKKNYQLRRAIYMCVNIIIHQFKFTFFDIEGGDGVLSLEDWAEMELSNSIWELDSLYKTFKEESGEEFNIHDELHVQSNTGVSVLDCLERQNHIEDLIRINKKVAIPLRKRINEIKVNIPFLRKQAKKYKDEDVGAWISHILNLFDAGFNIYKYISDAHKIEFNFGVEDGFVVDEDLNEALLPTSSFGYIFNGDDEYAKA